MIILSVFIVALLIALVFTSDYRRKDDASYSTLITAFVVLFLGGLASQYWVKPYGPVWQGISWIPLIFITIVFSLLLSAPSPYRKRKGNENNNNTLPSGAIGMLGWLLMVLLLIAAVSGFFKTST